MYSREQFCHNDLRGCDGKGISFWAGPVAESKPGQVSFGPSLKI